ncbi:TetR/AcrR family transcriptional regulator [Nocardioides alcanivorans]|uniref:TetR/AcrR family transcriptional regulator n=1 Tax=Nocardioides alcanivorans TaxID=2897352 RepID=UPI001F3ACF6B|nr:TetR/AcrR family transcriptional regulator [Nocardioides alcanivorans]
MSRRDELLRIAGELFARKGFRNTTVRDIADAAGILSGSLYHHFDSKETMVHELLDNFQTKLFADYDAIVASDLRPRAKLEAVLRRSFEAIEENHSEVAIFQNDAGHLGQLAGFGYLNERNARLRGLWTGLLREGIEAGELRSDLDIELVYRFLRDTVWVAVRWYRPDGPLSGDEVADQYRAILLDGIGVSTDSLES